MKNHFDRGFTLVETLVAVSIIAFAIAGPLAATSEALKAAYIARDKLTASYLAQEGIEYVRAVRDNAYLATKDSDQAWLNFGVTGGVGRCLVANGKECFVDPISSQIGPCGSSEAYSCDVVIEGDRFRQGRSGTNSIFSREVSVELIEDKQEARIFSTVTWSTRGNTYSITFTDNLTAWP